jgi:hypothetical protein
MFLGGKMKRDILKVKDRVRQMLKEDERCRNNDTWLILRVLQGMGFKVYIPYKDITKMPSFESIRRSRQFVQNEEKLYPATDKVILSRRQQQSKMRQIHEWI